MRGEENEVCCPITGKTAQEIEQERGRYIVTKDSGCGPCAGVEELRIVEASAAVREASTRLESRCPHCQGSSLLQMVRNAGHQVLDPGLLVRAFQDGNEQLLKNLLPRAVSIFGENFDKNPLDNFSLPHDTLYILVLEVPDIEKKKRQRLLKILYNFESEKFTLVPEDNFPPKIVIRSWHFDKENSQGFTAIYYAYIKNDIGSVEDFCEMGSSLGRGSLNEGIVHMAAVLKPELLQILATAHKKFDDYMDEENSDGKTPIFRAVESGNVASTIFLAERGASLKPCGPENETPLHLIAKTGNNELMDQVIGLQPQSAFIQHKNKKGMDAKTVLQRVQLFNLMNDMLERSKKILVKAAPFLAAVGALIIVYIILDKYFPSLNSSKPSRPYSPLEELCHSSGKIRLESLAALANKFFVNPVTNQIMQPVVKEGEKIIYDQSHAHLLCGRAVRLKHVVMEVGMPLVKLVYRN